MTTILKFAYIMIICLFLIHIEAGEHSGAFFYPLNFFSLFYTQSFISFIDPKYFMVYIVGKYIVRCQKDGDCDDICVTHGIPKCLSTMCFCK